MERRAAKIAEVVIRQYGHEEEFDILLDLDEPVLSHVMKELTITHHCTVSKHPVKPVLTVKPHAA